MILLVVVIGLIVCVGYNLWFIELVLGVEDVKHVSGNVSGDSNWIRCSHLTQK